MRKHMYKELVAWFYVPQQNVLQKNWTKTFEFSLNFLKWKVKVPIFKEIMF